MLDLLQYTDELKRAIHVAQSLAREYQNAQFTPAHLLRALLHEELGLSKILEGLEQDVPYLREWADIRIENTPKAARVAAEPTGDSKVTAVIEEADLIRLKLAKDAVDPLSVLLALSKPNVGFRADQLKAFPLSFDALFHHFLEQNTVVSAVDPVVKSAGKAPTEAKTLFKYCVDKTSLAREGKLDPIIGRDAEVRTVAEILGRRTKPNVIIVGEPGVGKTALIDGFARNIADKRVPSYLQSAVLLELDAGALVAGASYKGEIEDRLKTIIREIKGLGNKVILFIDEIHTLIDPKGAAGGGVSNLLKPELARGELTLIGATTNDEYKKSIEPDEAFSRRFELVRVEEPSVQVARRMLERLLPFYEQHHQLKVTEEALTESVRLARRYLKERRLPDAAIDLMDRTMAAIRMMSDITQAELELLEKNLQALLGAGKAPEPLLADLRWFYAELSSKVSPVLFNQLEEDTDPLQFDAPEQLADYLRHTISRLRAIMANKKLTVEPSDVAAVISHKTGIPLGKIRANEAEKLLNIEQYLVKRVIGQDHALKVLSEGIRIPRAGLNSPGKPMGSFFLLGPTGTGKTELSKAIAEFLFNDERYLLRFDMSEFKEEHSAAMLYGAPPGYVGYEEGGLLVTRIREKPYSVVLFDEIEKAHPSVFDLFLQILSEGKMTDKLGREGDFSNAVILFTSNIGSDYIVDQFSQGVVPGADALKDLMGKYFRPEFLGRLSEIVPFGPITEGNAIRILDVHAASLHKLLDKQGIALQLTPEAKQVLAKAGFSPRFGARPLIDILRNQLQKPISLMIISGELSKGKTLRVTTHEATGELAWEVSP